MIQRIQTIWLAVCAIAAALTFKLETFSGTNTAHPTMYKVAATENIFIVLLTAIVTALALLTIFMYKNRKLQVRLCLAGVVVDLLLLLHYYKEIKSFPVYSISIFSILHVIVIIGFLLAALAINKDEKLIRDSNRLR